MSFAMNMYYTACVFVW